VYVSLGTDGKSAVAPPLVLETDEDRQLWNEGEARQRRRTGR
jgi:hypothetical protein